MGFYIRIALDARGERVCLKFGRFNWKIASKNISNNYTRPAFLGKISLIFKSKYM
jgi:hypothetical protein